MGPESIGQVRPLLKSFWLTPVCVCVSIKIMTPKGQIVGKVYIIETITADKGCEILRGTPIDVKKTSFWHYLCFLKIITDYWCCRLSNRTLVEDGLSLNGTTLFELRYDESEHRFIAPQNIQFDEITNCSLSNFCDIILFSHSLCTAFPLKREQRKRLYLSTNLQMSMNEKWMKFNIIAVTVCFEITRVSFSASGASST